VIFVHGSPGLWRSWVRYLNDPALQARANLIAMDRPGFGGSGSGEIERGFLAQAQDLEPLLDHAQPGQRVILVGHAFGAALVTRMAMTYPDKVTDLVLLAAPLDPTLQKESWFQYAADVPPVSWLLPKEIVVFNREYLGLEQQLTEMLPLWPKVTQRVSLLLGEDDEEVPIGTAAFAEARLTQAAAVNIVRLPHTQHFIPWTRFDLVKAEILAHLTMPEVQ
jgi:pimeloyl-ACP methyl ester carboxylesterase